MKVKDLKANKRNPRKISGKKLEALKKSLEKFGDLSGFVFNRRTKQLVSGHQRSKSLPPDAKIIIEIKHDEPTDAMTVAEGYVLIGKERFKYREVDADESWEVEALLSANKHGGEWDRDKLALTLADFPTIDLEMTGFEIEELEAMDIDFTLMEIDSVQDDVSLGFSKFSSDEEEEEESDEDYIKNHQGPEDSVSKQTFDTINRHKEDDPNAEPSEVKEVSPEEAFNEVEEQTDIVGKRFIIIIDCKDDEHKKLVKSKIESIVKEEGGNFF